MEGKREGDAELCCITRNAIWFINSLHALFREREKFLKNVLILPNNDWKSELSFLHFTEEETEAVRGEGTESQREGDLHLGLQTHTPEPLRMQKGD